MQYIDISELKSHLNIEYTFTDDDNYLNNICLVASLTVNAYCNGGLINYSGTTTGYSGVTLIDVPIAIKHATLLFAGNLYLNRQPISFVQAYELPLSFKFLLDFYKNDVVI